tara:strand:+ start:550 stop:1791 length:1242 start_codon:yes stop_codon:yes gene_type:complete
MSDISEIGRIFSSLDDMEKVKLAEIQIAQKQEQFNAAQALKIEMTEKKRNYDTTKFNLNNRREENETEIARLVKEIGNWNVVAQEWSTIDDDFQTDDGKGILKELGIVYGENFKFKEQISSDYKVQLKNTEGLIGLQDMIINDLTKKENQILKLQEDWIKVGKDANVPNLKDSEDILKYMRLDTSGPDNSNKFINEDGSLKPLGMAFSAEKDSATDKYGFVDRTAVDTALNAMGTSEVTAEEKIEDKWNDEISFVFKDISSTENLLKSDNKMVEAAGGRMINYEGREDLYSDSNTQDLLLEGLADKITKSISYSMKGGFMFGNNRFSESRVAQIANAMENVTDKTELMKELHDLVIPSEPNQKLYGYGDKIWADESMEDIDLSEGQEQQTEELVLNKWIKAWGRIHNKRLQSQ